MRSKIKLAVGMCVLVASAIAFPDAYADVERGKSLYASRCSGCHHPDINRTGPMHRGVVGRRVGGVKSFRYSEALKSSKLVWNEKLLAKWLTNPEALIPGQDMGYKVDHADDRADLIDYLATLKK